MAPAAVLIFAFAGCGADSTVTGDYFERSSSGLEYSSVSLDSVVNYTGKIYSPSYAFAGDYNGTHAVTVLKFSRPTSSLLSKMEKLRLTFTVTGSWMTGTHEFAIYAVSNTSWSDTVRISEADFAVTGSALGTFSGSDTLSTMTFDLSDEAVNVVKNWSSTGTLLLKSTNGQSMVNVYTCNSGYSPILEVISETNSDTTNVEPIEMTYSFDPGVTTAAGEGFLSDADIAGFLAFYSFPDSFVRTSAINGGKLIIPITTNTIPAGETLDFTVGALTAKFVSYEDSLEYDYSDGFSLTSTDTQIVINLASVLGSWNAGEDSNFGLLFLPTTVTKTPSQIVVAPPDSCAFIFTPVPEGH